MTRDQAEKASLILNQIKEYEGDAEVIRKLHKQALNGDHESIDKLANAALELGKSMIRELENRLSLI